MTKPFKNIIFDWALSDYHGDGLRIRGKVRYAQNVANGLADKKEILVTSKVVSMRPTLDGIECETNNSIYLLK